MFILLNPLKFCIRAEYDLQLGNRRSSPTSDALRIEGCILALDEYQSCPKYRQSVTVRSGVCSSAGQIACIFLLAVLAITFFHSISSSAVHDLARRLSCGGGFERFARQACAKTSEWAEIARFDAEGYHSQPMI